MKRSLSVSPQKCFSNFQDLLSSSIILAMTVVLIGALSMSLPAQSSMYDLYVSSSNTNSVKLFNGQTGEYIKDFVAPGDGGLSNTQEIVFGPDGDAYVTGFGNTAIKKYDGQTGTYIEDFSKNYTLSSPAKMTFRYEDSLIYVSQWGGNRKVVRFRMSDGEFVDEFTSIGIPGNCGFAWDSANNLYVAGWGNNGTDGSVRKFDQNGQFVEVFISSVTLQGPVNCWWDGSELFVQDWTTGNIERYDEEKTYLGSYISNLVRTEGYDWDENDNLYLCDWETDVINQYDPQGNFVAEFASGGGMDTPNGLVFGPKYQATGIKEAETTLPDEFSLGLNYPNPFNPSTTIRYTLPAASDVRLEILNILGQPVRTLVQRLESAGHKEIVWDGRDDSGNAMPGGIYIYRLKADQFSATRKMILAK